MPWTWFPRKSVLVEHQYGSFPRLMQPLYVLLLYLKGNLQLNPTLGPEMVLHLASTPEQYALIKIN